MSKNIMSKNIIYERRDERLWETLIEKEFCHYMDDHNNISTCQMYYDKKHKNIRFEIYTGNTLNVNNIQRFSLSLDILSKTLKIPIEDIQKIFIENI